MLKCDFDICIYNEKHKCILDEVEISAEGCCGNCIIPDFPEDVLIKYKKELLDKFTARAAQSKPIMRAND